MKIIISVITSALSFPGPGLVGLHHLITHHIKQRHIPPLVADRVAHSAPVT